MSNYITEAFKQLNLLESEDISLDASGITELRSFLDDAAVDPDEEMMDIYDLKAEAEEDLAKSYEGKVVLECTVCHSHIFEDKENISMDEEGEACKDIECPYCMSNEGYFILGEIAPFNQEEADSFEEEETEEEVDLPDVDIEDAAEEVKEDDLEESLTEDMKLDGVEELYDNDEIRGVEELEGVDELEGVEALHGDKHEDPINEACDKKLNEASESAKETFKQACIDRDLDYETVIDLLSNELSDSQLISIIENVDEYDTFFESCKNKSLKEAIEDISVTTEDETMTMTTKEDGGVVIETMPKEEEFEAESDEEMIVPISDESSEVIDVATDALDSDDEEDFEALKDEMEEAEDETAEEEPVEDTEEAEEEFDEFDEESFDGLGESYLRSCYENVTNFKTSSIASQGNKLFIEGIIKFDSGNEKKTNFVFESIGNNKFEGYNEQISRGKKTFKLSGSVKDNKLVCESLNYNYRSKNELNESVRVYGTVKRK